MQPNIAITTTLAVPKTVAAVPREQNPAAASPQESRHWTNEPRHEHRME
jgi:hypothetical protein